MDVGHNHWTWANGALFRRPLSGIARAELLRGGITVFGLVPAQMLPAVDDAALRSAARGSGWGTATSIWVW